MDSEILKYLDKQKMKFYEEIPNFIAELKKGNHPLENTDGALLYKFHEIDALLALLKNLDDFNTSQNEKNRLTKTQVLETIFQSTSKAFESLDENSFIAGNDIDGKSYAVNFHFYANMISMLAFKELGDQYQPQIRDFIRRTKNGVLIAKPILEKYATYQVKAYRGLNLIFLDIATLHLASEFFNEPEWKVIAKKALERLMKRFDPEEGYMPDNRDEDEEVGPSTSYFVYTMFTVSFLLRLCPDNQLGFKLQRGLDWMMRSNYPNAQMVDIYDERGRLKPYSDAEFATISLFNRSPLFACSSGGREMIQYWESHATKKSDLGTIANDINFFDSILIKNMGFFDAMDSKNSFWVSKKESHYYCYQNNKSAFYKEGNWAFAFHGYLSGSIDPKTLWHRELQQHFSVYYHGLSVIIGGGNSLGQPEFSTFRTTASYLCDEVKILPKAKNAQSVLLINGGWQAVLTIENINQIEITISFTVSKKGQGEAFFQFPLVGYSSRKELIVDGKKVTTFDDQKAQGKMSKNISLCGATIEHNYHVSLTTHSEASFAWPVIPVNVREPGVPPLTLKEAVTVLTFPVHNEKETISISMKISIDKINLKPKF
jgi:hypothetical protein